MNEVRQTSPQFPFTTKMADRTELHRRSNEIEMKNNKQKSNEQHLLQFQLLLLLLL